MSGKTSLWLAMVAAFSLCVTAVADEAVDAAKEPPATKSKPAAKAAAKVKRVSAEREGELLEFVQQHHAELATLLKTLKTAQTKEYPAAISDLDREVRHLDQIRKRSPAQFDAELKVWVARSQVRLLSARMAMSDDEGLKDELKTRLRELRSLEVAALQAEIATAQQVIDKQQQKLQKLQSRLADMQTNDEDWLTKQLASLAENQSSDDAVKIKVKKKTNGKPKPKPFTAAP